MSRIVMSDKYMCFSDELKKLGYTVIFSDDIKVFAEPERKHTDMQILKIDNTVFLLRECNCLCDKLAIDDVILCDKSVGEKYPRNILLNFLYLNNVLYGKVSAIDPNLKKFCLDNGIKIVNVNQGYTRCSTLVISENAVITADTSIEKVLIENGVEVLKIAEGNIVLDGYNYGFIGGASGIIDDVIVFFGDVTRHHDFYKIQSFCLKHNKKIQILAKETMPLTDIGGIVVL